MADGVAYSASLGTTTGIRAARAALLEPSAALNRMWLKGSAEHLGNDGFFRFSTQHSVATKDDLFLQPDDSTPTPDDPLALSVKLVVTNVLTLEEKDPPFKEKAKGGHVQQKAELVMSQVQKHHPRIFAAFETRARDSSFETEHVFVYASGASKGSYCTQVWVAKGQHYAFRGDQKRRLNLRGFIQLHADPRRLIGRIFSKHVDFYIAAPHAPHSESSCDVNAWWDETLALLDGLSNLGILTDANAILGTETSSAVGHYGAEPQNSCGDRFHELLIELQAFLPATSADIDHNKNLDCQYRTRQIQA